jgi:F-type H+-transporting ATPase subunit epsilon
MSLEVQVVSPERILYSGNATMVVCRTIGGGDIAFLTGHAAFIGALDTHEVKVVADSGPEQLIAVHGGFVEVSNNRVTVLSDVAELPEQIDRARAERARERAEAALRANAEDPEAKAALARAEVRIRVALALAGISSH